METQADWRVRLEGFRYDLVHSMRLLLHHYRTSAASVVTIALAIGAITVVFGVFDAVVLRVLPGSAANRLLSVAYTVPGDAFRTDFGHLELAEAKRRWTPFDQVESYTLPNLTPMLTPGGSERGVTSIVSTSYVELFGARPFLGRTFLPADSAADSERVVLLAYSLWRHSFGSDPGVVGQHVNVSSTPHRVVGVMPPDFAMPVSWIQAWLPDVDTVSERNYAGFTHRVIARLAPGWSVSQARQSVLGEPRRLARVRTADPSSVGGSSQTVREAEPSLTPLRDELVGPVGFAATLLLAVAAVILVLACVNVAMLLVSRNAGREREFGLRLAMGATRYRLVAQSWLESVFLSIAGGAVGTAVALLSLGLIRQLGPVTVPRLREVALDGQLFLFAVAAIVVTTVGVGMMPALQVRDAAVRFALNGAHRGPDRTFGGAAGFGFNGVLTAAQVALVLLLVSVASLLLRSVTQLLALDPGFNPAGVMAVQLESRREGSLRTSDEIADEIGQLRGVQSVAASAYWKSIPTMSVTVDGVPGKTFDVSYQVVSSRYFSTLAIPLLDGTGFRSDDRRTDPCTVVINKSFANAAWPGQPVVGRKIGAFGSCTVTAVVGDVRVRLDTNPGYQIYFSNRAGFGSADTLLIRLAVDSASVRSAVVGRVKALAPNRRIDWIGSVSDVLFDRIATPPFYAFVFGWFAVLGLVLGAVGVYGTMSQLVVQRWREIGVRLALGAKPTDIRWMVLGRSLAILGTGIVAGLAAAIAIGKWMGGMLYDLAPADPAALAIACTVVLVVGLVASSIPSRRASMVDPMGLLRSE